MCLPCGVQEAAIRALSQRGRTGEPLKIGRLKLPEVVFPDGIADRLRAYRDATGDSVSYIAQEGIDSPELAGSTDRERSLLRLYAAFEHVREDPENGLAAHNVAPAFGELEQVDDAISVLTALHELGAPGCYPFSHEDPAFRAGLILVDENRHREAIEFYRRALQRVDVREKGPYWAHLGAAHHEISEFGSAIECYEKAMAAFREPVLVENESLSPLERERLLKAHVEESAKQISLVEVLKAEAIAYRDLPSRLVKRDAFGLSEATLESS